MARACPRTARRAVVVFARSPAAEAGAKRLSYLAPIFAHLRDRTLRAAASAPDAELIYAGDPGRALLPPGAAVVGQRGATFGARLSRVLDEVTRRGYDEIVVVGTDSPEMGTCEIREAFDRLDAGARLVLGPAADGGVYLIGLRGRAPRGLDAVPWGGPRVLASLAGLDESAVVLETRLRDIDAPPDLWRLAAERVLPVELHRLLLSLRTRGEGGPDGFGSRILPLLEPLTRRGPPTLRPAPRG